MLHAQVTIYVEGYNVGGNWSMEKQMWSGGRLTLTDSIEY